MAERDQVMHGLIVKTQSGGGAANPLVWIAAAAARDINRFASEFGMSPASRSVIATGGPIGPSKFDGLLGGTPRPPDLQGRPSPDRAGRKTASAFDIASIRLSP